MESIILETLNYNKSKTEVMYNFPLKDLFPGQAMINEENETKVAVLSVNRGQDRQATLDIMKAMVAGKDRLKSNSWYQYHYSNLAVDQESYESDFACMKENSDDINRRSKYNHWFISCVNNVIEEFFAATKNVKPVTSCVSYLNTAAEKHILIFKCFVKSHFNAIKSYTFTSHNLELRIITKPTTNGTYLTFIPIINLGETIKEIRPLGLNFTVEGLQEIIIKDVDESGHYFCQFYGQRYSVLNPSIRNFILLKAYDSLHCPTKDEIVDIDDFKTINEILNEAIISEEPLYFYSDKDEKTGQDYHCFLYKKWFIRSKNNIISEWAISEKANKCEITLGTCLFLRSSFLYNLLMGERSRSINFSEYFFHKRSLCKVGKLINPLCKVLIYQITNCTECTEPDWKDGVLPITSGYFTTNYVEDFSGSIYKTLHELENSPYQVWYSFAEMEGALDGVEELEELQDHFEGGPASNEGSDPTDNNIILMEPRLPGNALQIKRLTIEKLMIECNRCAPEEDIHLMSDVSPVIFLTYKDRSSGCVNKMILCNAITRDRTTFKMDYDGKECVIDTVFSDSERRIKASFKSCNLIIQREISRQFSVCHRELMSRYNIKFINCQIDDMSSKAQEDKMIHDMDNSELTNAMIEKYERLGGFSDAVSGAFLESEELVVGFTFSGKHYTLFNEIPDKSLHYAVLPNKWKKFNNPEKDRKRSILDSDKLVAYHDQLQIVTSKIIEY